MNPRPAVLSAFLAIALVAFTACGSSSSEPAAGQSEGGDEPAASPEAPTAAPPEDRVGAANSLVPDEPFDAPYGVDVAPDGTTYVFDTGNNRVVVFDAEGAEIATWGGPGSGDGEFDSLGFGALAIGPDSAVYVVDNGNFRLQVFEPDGTFRNAFGAEGDQPGEFTRVIGIEVTDDAVLVTDDAVPWVQVFDLDGTPRDRLGGPDVFEHATGITVGDDGTILVSDYEAEQVVGLTADGVVVDTWRLPGGGGTFVAPEGLAVTPDGTVLVTTYSTGDVHVLPSESGDSEWPLVVDGSAHPGHGLSAPVDIALTGDNRIVVADQRLDAVRVYTLDE